MVQWIRLVKVQDAYTFDGGKVMPKIKDKINLSKYHSKSQQVIHGVTARIDYEMMRKLKITSGDVIEIKKGKNRTTVKCFPLYPSDEDKKIIRLDSDVRSNIGVDIDDNVSIKKAKTVKAKKVIGRVMESGTYFEDYDIGDSLIGIPLIKEQVISVPYFSRRAEIVIDVVVPDSIVVITKKTNVEIYDGDTEI